MKLKIEHETQYRFDEPANHSIQYLRLTPRHDPCQYVVNWRVSTPGRSSMWTDGFDNTAHISVQDTPHEEVSVLVSGEVETVDTAGVLPADDGLPPLIFLRETPFTRCTPEINEFAHAAPASAGSETLDTMHRLMTAIADTVSYEPGYTDVETDAAHALEQKKGVCQDHAHLFIASARVLGVPARYVSGYILAGEGNDSHLASHAWAEAFVNRLGWVSFDPTNRQSATESYVRLAIAFDFAGASPVRGVREGGGTENLNVRVQVAQSQS